MNYKIFLVLRIIFGLYLLFFGFDHFFNYIPFPDMSLEANEYFQNLYSTYAMHLVGIVEIAAGLAFIFDKYGALMSLILMSVSINAVLFHLFLDPEKIWGALVLLLFNILMIYGYKRRYTEIVKA